MKPARFASARGLSVAAATLAVVLPSIRAARGAEAPAMLVATRDPALLSALDAAFSPRGVHVAMADRPLRATGDDLGAGARGADLVWLCDVTPALAPPSPSGGAAPATALCVRPHQGTVIIRRVAVTTPLSPEDAAALALSVQVALMPDAKAPQETLARPTPAAAPPPAASDSAPGLTVELGFAMRSDGGNESAQPSAGAVYSPWLNHRLGLGFSLGLGRWERDFPMASGPGPQLTQSSVTFASLRLFARRQARLGPIWVQLDLGPEAYLGRADQTSGRQRFAGYEMVGFLDGFLGGVVPLGRFFVGARAGAAYVVTGPFASANPFTGTWSTEALATAGAGWF